MIEAGTSGRGVAARAGGGAALTARAGAGAALTARAGAASLLAAPGGAAAGAACIVPAVIAAGGAGLVAGVGAVRCPPRLGHRGRRRDRVGLEAAKSALAPAILRPSVR